MTVQEFKGLLDGMPPLADVECTLTGEEDLMDTLVIIEGAEAGTCPRHDPGRPGTVVIIAVP